MMLVERSSKIKYFIGIDISKHKLDFAVIEGDAVKLQKTIPNQVKDILALIEEFKQVLIGYSSRKALFCMESTGIYGNHLLVALVKLKAIIVVENALHIKRSMGLIRDKTDRKDACRIALFAQRHLLQLKLWQPPRAAIVRLRHLSELRERLVSISVMLQLPLKEHRDYIQEKLKKEALRGSSHSITAVKADLKRIEQQILKVIQADPHLSHLEKLVTSVPGIGKHTALQLILRTNEFKSIDDAKKFACYAGVAPFKFESGLSTTRARVSPYANKKMKSLLHICAVRVIRVDPEIRNYYLRKTEAEKKPKMLVINAIRNKLLRRVFTCVTENRPFVRHDVEPQSGS